ncbi:hypothetical protein DVH24_009225 [Malus domestica]|uniref:Mot1 central domain-containing protein n=1 Tax=Malus domestica TaxID=3750 RepID=A0A498IKS3_MALDO|nr:hypothetical protein DVH24_009225 [Malus domestica]
MQYVIDPLTDAFTSLSGVQRQVASMVLISWFKEIKRQVCLKMLESGQSLLSTTKIDLEKLNVDNAINFASKLPMLCNDIGGNNSFERHIVDDIDGYLLLTVTFCNNLQSNLHVTVSSLVAASVVWMSELPERLNPIILPLMASIKREQETILQEKAAEALAELILTVFHVVRSIASMLNEDLKPKLLTLLPYILKCIRHSHVAVRLASSRCITTMAKSKEMHVMGAVIEMPYPFLLLLYLFFHLHGALPLPVGLTEGFSRSAEDATFLEQLLDNSHIDDYKLCTELKVTLRSRTSNLNDGNLPSSLIICPSTLVGHWAFENREKYIDLSVISTLQYVGSAQERIALREHFGKHNAIITSYDVNNVMDLWSLFDFVMPGFLGTERQFQATFGKNPGGSQDPKCSAKDAEAGALAMEALHKAGTSVLA